MLRARCPSDLISVIPYLLGFHPRESVVVLVLDGAGIVLTARWDIPAAEHAHQLPPQVAALLADNPAQVPGFVVFTTDPRRGADLLAGLVAGCRRSPAFAYVTDDCRWWGLGDAPDEGRTMPDAVSPIVAAAVVNGMCALGDRGELAAGLTPLTGVGAEVVAARDRLRRRLRRRRIVERELMVTELQLLTPVSDEEALVRAGLLVGTERLWLHAWRGLRRVVAPMQREFWQAVLRVTLPEDAAPVLTLIGVAAWLQGDGVLTSICAERAQALDEHASGVRFLDLLIGSAVRPSEYETVFADLLDGDPSRGDAARQA